MADFEEFWKHYPRKIAKKPTLLEWNKLTEEEQTKCIEVIHKHVAYWKSTNTEMMYIPHARTWLHQGRYDDELEIAEPKSKVDVAWWSTEATVIAKGNEYGLSPRPGEDIHTFKGRVIERIKQAA